MPRLITLISLPCRSAVSVTNPGRGAGLPQRPGEFLAHHQALLVLDNCAGECPNGAHRPQHIITVAARLAGNLLARCPEPQILAASREGLAVAGCRRKTTRPGSSAWRSSAACRRSGEGPATPARSFWAAHCQPASA